MSADRTQHVIDAIDGALADDEFPDAMRWTPEPETVKDAPAPFDGELVWQPPQRYEQAGRSASPADLIRELLGDAGIPVGLEHRRPGFRGGAVPPTIVLDETAGWADDYLARRIRLQEAAASVVAPARIWVAPAGTDAAEWTDCGYLVDDTTTFEPIWPSVAVLLEVAEEIGQRFAEAMSAISAAFGSWPETIGRWRRELEGLWPVAPECPEPEDRRARALRLRRTRGTGPSRDLTRQRRPRRLS